MDSQIQETNLWLPKGRGNGGNKLGVWDLQTQTAMYKIEQQQGYII